jgi:hypothetical protein
MAAKGSLAEFLTRVLAERWGVHYDTRPHSSLGSMPLSFSVIKDTFRSIYTGNTLLSKTAIATSIHWQIRRHDYLRYVWCFNS